MSEHLQSLSRDELLAEYDLCNEHLAFHKEQVGYVSEQLRDLQAKLVERKQVRDQYVAAYDAVRAELSRRKALNNEQ